VLFEVHVFGVDLVMSKQIEGNHHHIAVH